MKKKHKKSKKLEKKYNRIVRKYIKLFEKKQGIEFGWWVIDLVGGIANFGSYYFFDFLDIKFDIDNNIPKGVFLEWFETQMYGNMKINYVNYIKKYDYVR